MMPDVLLRRLFVSAAAALAVMGCVEPDGADTDAVSGADHELADVATPDAAAAPAVAPVTASALPVWHGPDSPFAPYDVLAEPHYAERPLAPAPALAERLALGRHDVQLEHTLGVPSFLWIVRDASAQHAEGDASAPGRVEPFDLSDVGGVIGAGGGGAAPVLGGGGGAVPLEPVVAEAAARRALVAHAALYRLTPEQIAQAELERVHDLGRGPLVVSFVQRFDGQLVWGERVSVLLSRTLEPIAISGYLTAHVDGAPVAAKAPPALEAADAIAAALGASDLALDAAELVERPGRAGYRHFALRGDRADLGLRSELRALPVWLALPDRLARAWYIELDADVDAAPGGHVGLGVVVDAADGRLLVRSELVHDAAYHVRVGPDGLPLPSPYGKALNPRPPLDQVTAPDELAPTRVDVVSRHPLGDPWLLPGATETLGNHVDAYSDATGKNGFDDRDHRANLGPSGTFDAAYDFDRAPLDGRAQAEAPIVQLFYTINTLHDLFYAHGFDEASGNAQADNLGRGGVAGDRLLAESADQSGSDNANMFTPADGASPRMQMFLYRRGSRGVVDVTAPSWLDGRRTAAMADAPEHFDVSAALVVAHDAVGAPEDGCEALASDVRGRIALVERGGCTFADKAARAEAAGAAGLVVANNDTEQPDAVIGGMSGFPSDARLPVLMVSLNEATRLREAASHDGVELRLRTLPAQDGALDNDLVVHEWAHYLFGRLTPPIGSHQMSSMNEGNSDFVALLLAVRAEDALQPGNAHFEGAYPIATWAGRRHEFGVRRAPYSTDPTLNPFTLGHIAADAPMPQGAVLSPNAAYVSPAEVHNSGEVWAQAMWEVYAAMLQVHGFAQARQRMLDDLVAALKLFPARATFTEARDAFLAVAHARDPADFDLYWQAFARRGFGVGARAPERHSKDHLGVVESFELGGVLTLSEPALDESVLGCDRDGFLDIGESAKVRAQLSNTGAEALEGVAVRIEVAPFDAPDQAHSGARFALGEVQVIERLAPMEAVEIELEVTLDDALPLDAVVLRLVADHPDVDAPTVRERRLFLHADELAQAGRCDGFDAHESVWTSDLALGSRGEPLWTRVVDAAQTRWHGQAVARRSDVRLVSPPLDVSAETPFVVELEHRYVFEENAEAGIFFDGGVIELSSDGGQTWRDVAQAGAQGVAYDAVIVDLHKLVGAAANQTNPLADRLAFGGTNPSYPLTDRLRLDFGTALAGQTVQLRLRIGTDADVGAEGWRIDHVAVSGTANTPFPSLVAEEGLDCAATPGGAAPTPSEPGAPVARIALPGAACGGERVVLDGSASTDPQGEPLSFAWRQTAGPPVALSDGGSPHPSFVAPHLTEEAVLRFELTVDDGVHVSEPAGAAVVVHASSERVQQPVEGLQPPRYPETEADVDCSCAAVRASSAPPRGTWPLAGLALLLGAMLALRRRR